ncbi:MAG TPA: hypothetical protein VF903_09835 [Nitrospirota bacterium]
MLRFVICVVCCAGLTVSTASCAFIQRVAVPAEHERKIAEETANQTQAFMTAGEYKKALDLYSSAYDKYHYRGMRGGYARTGEQIRNAADAAYQRRNFAEAGNIYTVLFESGITTRDFAPSLSFDDDYLTRQGQASSKALTEIGLMKYREEKLEEAIAIWKKVLLFDPENKGVRNAIDTATMQLQKLKSIK